MNPAAKEVDGLMTKHRTVLQEILVSMSSSVDAAVSIEKLEEGHSLVLRMYAYVGIILKVGKLEEAMLSYAEMEQKIKDHMTALEKLKASVPRNPTEEFDSVKEFQTKLRELKKQKNDPTNHNKYKDFKQKVWVCQINI